MGVTNSPTSAEMNQWVATEMLESKTKLLILYKKNALIYCESQPLGFHPF